MKNILFLVIAVLSLSFLISNQFQVSIAQNQSIEKIDALLERKLHNQAKSSVLVLLKAKADLSQARKLETKEQKGKAVYEALRKVALESQKDLSQFLDQRSVKYKRFYIANLVLLKDVDSSLIAEVAKREDVEKIYDNPQFQFRRPKVSIEVWDSGQNREALPQENIVQVRAPEVWKKFGTKGEGILVAGQDTGVQWDHPALIQQYRGRTSVGHDYSWHDAISEPLTTIPNLCGYDLNQPCDDNRHGTHTLGTAVGSDGNENQIGVAPKAQWMACRNMDSGNGTPATYIDCFEYFLAPYAYHQNPMVAGKPELAPHVINNSWGCPLSEGCSGQEMIPVLEALKAAGVFVVASAGNDGPDCSSIADQPAHLSQLSFSVGAVDSNNGIAFFSSRGPSLLTGEVVPDLTAPGMSIRSAVPGSGYEGGWAGTSMAGPHVAGVVALLWSAQPKLIGKVNETMEILRKTSKPLTTIQECGTTPGTQIPNNTFGYGLVDAYKAVEQAMKL